jgi:uncharacterized protein (TIGR02996 family)
MGADEPFLRAINEAPDDLARRLVYADLLDDRTDPRAEFVRLGCQLAALPAGHRDGLQIRRRMLALRGGLPAEWLALFGDFRTARGDPDPVRVEAVARALRRPARFVDVSGYEHWIVAAAPHPFRPVVAYVECRSREEPSGHVDIDFQLRVREGGELGAWPIETYNPYFGCDVQFLEWYGAAAVAVYREKHHTYICRFGLGSRPEFKQIEDCWVLDGRHLGYWGYRETVVRRLAVPELMDLPTLTLDEAAAWDLVPRKFW